ncbi:UNVERIFIED_CONTAM: hypothetical protein FKN15_027487 [Acipenser sinensis]
MQEPPPPAGSLHCQSAATSEGPETGEQGKEKGPSGTDTQVSKLHLPPQSSGHFPSTGLAPHFSPLSSRSLDLVPIPSADTGPDLEAGLQT